MMAGRITVDILSMIQGVGGIAGGATMTIGGVSSCGTGVLCPAGVVVSAGGVVLAAESAGVLVAGSKNFVENTGHYFSKNSGSGNSSITPLKGKEAADAARELGYTIRVAPQAVPFNSHGQPAFFNPKTKTYITPDIDSHIGGFWKMFNSKFQRLGTFDANLTQIGN